MAFELRNVAVVGISSLGACGDHISAFLRRTGREEEALGRLAAWTGRSQDSFQGHIGIRPLEREIVGFDPQTALRKTDGSTAPLPVTFAGQLPTGFDLKEVSGFKGPRFKSMGRVSLMAVFGALQAISELGMTWDEFLQQVPPHMIGSYISSGVGAFDRIEELVLGSHVNGRVTPSVLAEALPDTSGGHVGMILGLEGTNSSPVGACATGGLSLYDAFHAIRTGRQIAAFAGGYDGGLTLSSFRGFHAATALIDDADLAKHGLQPHQASRPFDRRRSGFVMGEGGGTLFLMDEQAADELGIRKLARVLGAGNRGDGFQRGLPSPGSGIRLAMGEVADTAREDGGFDIGQLDLYEAHGTSTPQNDPNETGHLSAFLAANGRDPNNPLDVTGQKDEDGHRLGGAFAAAAVELILFLQTGFRPGARNLDELDPAIAALPHLRFPRQPEQLPGHPRAGMVGTLGFAHHNAVGIFGQPGEQHRTPLWGKGEETARRLIAREIKLAELLPVKSR